MRSFLTKGWILFMLVVMGLTLLGVGYTLWNKQQTIEGVVNMNDIDVVKVKVFTNDDNKVDDADKDADDIGLCGADPTSCDPADVPSGDGTTPRYDKDIGTCTATIDAASTGEKMTFHIFDAFPSYYCAVWFDDHGLGSVPAVLQRIKLNGQVICPSHWYDVDADQDGEPDANVHIEAPALGTQLDTSDIVQGQVDVHIKQGAPQGKAFVFTIYLIWTTWSEYDPAATGCFADGIIDADGIATPGDGLGTCGYPHDPGSLEVSFGDPLTAWPAAGIEGIDMFDNDMNGDWSWDCHGDDLHLEDPNGACATGNREGTHDQGLDCRVLDYDSSLLPPNPNNQPVACDLEGMTSDPSGSGMGFVCPAAGLLAFYDANGDGSYNNGEDIVYDTNLNGVFD